MGFLMCSSPLKAAGQAEGRLTLSSPFSIPFHFITSLCCCQLRHFYIFLIPQALWTNDSGPKTNTERDVGVKIWGFMWNQGLCLTDWLTDWLAGWEALKPLLSHSTRAVLAHELYCIVRVFPIPAQVNRFNHWFRFSYTVLVESVPLPPLWTPWFPWLTCLEATMEMSCCPSHGLDPTFTLIGNKKNHLGWGWTNGSFLMQWITNLRWNVAVWW